MRIACLLYTGHYYGAENITLLFAKHMSTRHDVWYCSPEGRINGFLEEAGVTHVPVGKVSVKSVKYLMKKLKPDIFLVLDNKASMICALAGVPFVSYQQNNWPFISSYNIFSLGMLYYCKRAKKVIGLTDFIIEEFKFSKYIRDKYITIGNVVDLSHVKKLAGDIPQDKKYDLSYFGRLTEQKNPELFLSVVKRLTQTHPETTAVMVGGGEKDDELKSLAAQLGISGQVTFTGFLTNPFEVIKQSKMLVMTSRYEGFCIAAFEAMALGIPVIASRVPTLDRNIDDSCGALCSNEDEFYKVIAGLFDDDEAYREKSQGALERAKVFGDVDNYISEMEKVCLEAVDMHPEKK